MHYTANETIGGVEFSWVPETGDVPLVSDMSSNILSRPVDVSRFGLIYAGAQKNIGPGRTDHRDHPRRPDRARPARRCRRCSTTRPTPRPDSMYNTPPTYAIYIAGLVFRAAAGRPAGWPRPRSATSPRRRCCTTTWTARDFYANPVGRPDRSRMNVPFTLADPALDAEFLAGADERGLIQLKGHRSVGRDAGLALQRDADRGRPGAGRLPGRLRRPRRGLRPT